MDGSGRASWPGPGGRKPPTPQRQAPQCLGTIAQAFAEWHGGCLPRGAGRVHRPVCRDSPRTCPVMAENPSGGEKTELPTPKRLEEARLEGQVSFSAEVNIAVLLLVGFCSLAVAAPWAWTSMMAMMRLAFSDALHWELDERETSRAFIDQLLMTTGWLAPLLGVLFVTGLGLSIAQVG